MAESKENILTKGFSGTVARLLTFRQKPVKRLISAAGKGSPFQAGSERTEQSCIRGP
jgi:hypothetical protein